MADNDLDSGTPGGTAGTPTPPSSSGGSDSKGSFDAGKLQSLIEGFGKRIEEIDARTRSLQGDKDRGVVKTKKEVEELKAKIAEYEKLKSKGMEPDEALDEMYFRSTVRQLQSQLGKLESVPSQPAGNGQAQTGGTAEVIKKAGLDANNAGVIDLIAKYGNDPIEFAVRVGEYKATQASHQPSVTSSTALQGPPPSGAPDVAQMTETYKEKFAAIPRGKAGNSQRAALRDDFRKKGVKVDEITFG